MKHFNCNCKCAERFKGLAETKKALCYIGIAIAVVLLCLLVCVSVNACKKACGKDMYTSEQSVIELESIRSREALLWEMERELSCCDSIDGNSCGIVPDFPEDSETRREFLEITVPGILQGKVTLEEFRQLVYVGAVLYCVPVVLFLLFLLTWVRVTKIKCRADDRILKVREKDSSCEFHVNDHV